MASNLIPEKYLFLLVKVTRLLGMVKWHFRRASWIRTTPINHFPEVEIVRTESVDFGFYRVTGGVECRGPPMRILTL